ncbi:MAG: BACON domain-containing protein [Deltaproteobacteria bacterium]|nr:BACON domain-containing protein [Deltaproteobacteria bacterium]
MVPNSASSSVSLVMLNNAGAPEVLVGITPEDVEVFAAPPPPPCVTDAIGPSRALSSNGDSDAVVVKAPQRCAWHLATAESWITVNATGNERAKVGDGQLGFTVTPNTTGAPRTGKLLVMGKEAMITQAASSVLRPTGDKTPGPPVTPRQDTGDRTPGPAVTPRR